MAPLAREKAQQSSSSKNAGILIQQYHNQLHDLRRVGGTANETVVREAFKDLLKGFGRSHDLIFIPEYEIFTPKKERRVVDGALLHELRVPFGHWEAKDAKDDLDAEIEFKFKRGYPQDNIIFEDSRYAVLIQDRDETMRCAVEDVSSLRDLLDRFFGHQRKEYAEFRKAIEQFKADLPAVLSALRDMIESAERRNPTFRRAAEEFLAHSRKAINPSLGEADVREMLIQHVLTEGVFAAVFPDTPFHEDNNVARELYKLEATFFTGDTKYRTLKAMGPYYASIRTNAAQIGSHHEKQTFLKVLYENFYKVYNPGAAERLGVVYTPNQIVRFMIESADALCERHFGCQLIDKNVEILDPATGTGTFICELLEHFRGQPAKLARKYKEELHANEVAILPYYVANLNIEATYAALKGEYVEFPNLCFVDTLDNVGLHTAKHGTQGELFGRISDENAERIRRQNYRRISVIVGNPPYYANQENENDNNKSRPYPKIDGDIKKTYIAAGSAQKTKLYDMYVRFFRWASDRLEAKGVLAFITNRSFIDKRTYSGFRKVVADEFNEIYVFDLGGAVNDNPKLSGTKHNVFGIKTGVAITFMVKDPKLKGCKIFYARRPEFETAEEKLAVLGSTKFSDVEFEPIRPDAAGNWLDLADNDFESLLPLASKATKAATKPAKEKAIFKLYSLGISTNRDEWVYGETPKDLAKKMRFFIDTYEAQDPDAEEFDTTIKWSRNLKRRFLQDRREPFSAKRIVEVDYRPFRKRHLYDSDLFIDEGGSKDQLFPPGLSNLAICFSDVGHRADYCVLAVSGLADLHFGASVDAYQQAPLYRYEDGQRVDNITDWALKQFRGQYREKALKRKITKEAIFCYVYAVLHNPAYRRTYASNLRQGLPRIPFYADFWAWADWGHKLMELHVGYQSVAPFPLKRSDARARNGEPTAILKAEREGGRIILDSQTMLSGVPSEAWGYKLGNRSALEWVLDQHKEKTPKDPTIREQFNTYRFADHKGDVVDLLARVTTVSVETQKIIASMQQEVPRSTLQKDRTAKAAYTRSRRR